MRTVAIAGVTLLSSLLMTTVSSGRSRLPDPARDIPIGSLRGPQTAVLAGGCFWGVEAVFERLAGVSEVVSGYAGGSKATARYQLVGHGTTGHAESVKITYDPAIVSYGRLLKVFFAVAHDPTEVNRQGPDVGPQYRSAIFYATADEKTVAEGYIRQLDDAKIFPRRIATKVVPLEGFYEAEREHQDFLARNPTHPYIVYTDLPKIDALEREFPQLLKRK